MRDGPTDGATHGPTDGRTKPLTELLFATNIGSWLEEDDDDDAEEASLISK